jgi:hypothetical protein
MEYEERSYVLYKGSPGGAPDAEHRLASNEYCPNASSCLFVRSDQTCMYDREHPNNGAGHPLTATHMYQGTRDGQNLVAATLGNMYKSTGPDSPPLIYEPFSTNRHPLPSQEPLILHRSLLAPSYAYSKSHTSDLGGLVLVVVVDAGVPEEGLVAVSPGEVLGPDVLVGVLDALLERGHVAPVLPVLVPEVVGVVAREDDAGGDTTVRRRG